MKRKALARICLGLSLTLTAASLTGCTFGFASDPDDPNEVVQEEPIDTSTDTFQYDTSLSGTSITLLNSKAEIQVALEKMSAEYESRSGVHVEVMPVTDGDSPYTKVVSLYNSGNPPTLSILDTTDVIALAEEKAADLSAEPWIAEAEGYLTEVNGKVYSFPLCIIKSPFSWLFTIKGLSFDNFVKAFTQMDFLNAFKNSLIVTVSATVLVTLLAAMLAYYIVRHKNWISNVTFSLMVASMIIPFQAIMIPLVSIYGGTLNVLNHRLTLIFMHTGFSMAMSVFMFHGFLNGNIPIALEEAAYIDGCTHSQTFFRIVFPLLKPIISTMVILNALAFWNDFLLPSLVLTDKKLLTLPLSTYSFYGTYSADYGTIMAGLLLCVIPILILYMVLQKQIINGVVAGAVK